MEPAAASCISGGAAAVSIQGSWRRSLCFTNNSPRPPFLGAETRALVENGGRCGGVCPCPAQSALLEKENMVHLEIE